MAERPEFRLHASVLVTDDAGRLLLVQEGKPQTRDRWNLPGGHVDHGESITAGAARELREETGLTPALSALLGIYSTDVSVRFVFLAKLGEQKFHAGDEILDVRLMTPIELLAMPNSQLVSPLMLRQIMADLVGGKSYPIDVIAGRYG